MNCSEMMERLNAWVDGGATARESAAVRLHLSSCAGCRGQVRWLKAMKTAVAGVAAAPMPAELKALLRRQAREAAGRKAGRRWPRRLVELLQPRPLAGLGLAAGLAAAAVVLVIRSSDGPVETVPVQEMLAAHRSYVLTMPLANQETGLSGLAEALAGGPL